MQLFSGMPRGVSPEFSGEAASPLVPRGVLFPFPPQSGVIGAPVKVLKKAHYI